MLDQAALNRELAADRRLMGERGGVQQGRRGMKMFSISSAALMNQVNVMEAHGDKHARELVTTQAGREEIKEMMASKGLLPRQRSWKRKPLAATGSKLAEMLACGKAPFGIVH